MRARPRVMWSVMVMVVAGSCTSAHGVLRTGDHPPPAPTSGSASSPASAPIPDATPSAAPSPPSATSEIQQVLTLPGPVTALASGDGDILYAAYPTHEEPGRQVIVRYDPVTGSVRRSPPLPGGRGGTDRLAFDGGSVWATSGTAFTRRGRTLFRLDGTSLAVIGRVNLLGTTVALAAVPAGLWVAAGTSLELLDAATGAIVRSIRFPGRVRLLAADPTGERLYLTTDGPIRHDETPVLELDAETGATIAGSWQGYADLRGPTGLSATGDGVWLTQPTGTMAALKLLRAGDLHQIASFARPEPNSLTAYVAGGILWVANPFGRYACADPSTGRLLGRVGVKGSPSGVSDVVETPSGLYVGGSSGLLGLRPPPSCLGG